MERIPLNKEQGLGWMDRRAQLTGPWGGRGREAHSAMNQAHLLGEGRGRGRVFV